MRWDAVISDVAGLFLDTLSKEDEQECRQVILNNLCDNPDPATNPFRRPVEYYPNRPGVIECAVGRWYFRYRNVNRNTVEVATIFFSPMDPKHPLYAGP